MRIENSMVIPVHQPFLKKKETNNKREKEKGEEEKKETKERENKKGGEKKERKKTCNKKIKRKTKKCCFFDVFYLFIFSDPSSSWSHGVWSKPLQQPMLRAACRPDAPTPACGQLLRRLGSDRGRSGEVDAPQTGGFVTSTSIPLFQAIHGREDDNV